ncbi:MAG: cation:proton antiporter [Clostridiales bacterium]|nr:cation:proton antiporter [Clostridiales bacterium]
MDYTFLLVIAVILLFTKSLGILSQKVHMPQVVGSLAAGLILGPSVLGIIPRSEYVAQFSEIGVILLMFLAGLETDISELKRNGAASLVIAAVGVAVPLAMGAALYWFWFGLSDPQAVLRGIFTGVVLTATSVSITVETLREMGKLSGKAGMTILGAAIIDDILGIIVLTLVSSLGEANADVKGVFLKIGAYFVFLAVLALMIKKGSSLLDSYNYTHRISIGSLCFCLILSYVTEAQFGIADITGAYFAGILLCNLRIRDYVSDKANITSYMFFSPIFFASLGIDTNLRLLTPSLFVFALLLLAVAVASKLLGCGLGAKLMGYTNRDALTIGAGMISRGEVALIVAQKGEDLGLIDNSLFPAIIFVVIITTIIAPIFLKAVIPSKEKEAQI